MSGKLTLHLTVAIALTSCSSGTSTGAVVTDSAGVAIVQNAGEQLPRWHLETEPKLTIGSESLGPEYQLFRVVGAVRTRDETIVVANSGSAEIRFYGSDGAYLHATGSEGEGPGEFRALSLLQRMANDTLFVFDRSLARYSVFAPDGHFIRSKNLNAGGGGPGSPGALGMLANGWVPVQQMRGGIVAFAEGETDDPNTTATLEFRLVPDDTAEGVVVASYPAPETRITIGEGSISVRRNPLATATHAVVAMQSLFVGHSGRFQIDEYDLGGELKRVIRFHAEPYPITESEIEQLIRTRSENAPNPDAKRGIESTFRDMEYAENFPAFDGFLVDRLGWLWVRNFLRPTDDSAQWHVFTPAGVASASVAIPREFTLMDAGADYVLGRWQDEFDLEQVMVFGLRDRSPTED